MDQTNMDAELKRALMTGYGLSGSFLLIHIAMFLFFRHYGVTPMAHFNIFSIVFYLATFWMLKTDRLWIYTVGAYLEVVLHMTLSVVFVGADSGFQVTLLGTCALIFYAEYLGDHLKRRHVSGAVLSAVSFAMYLFSIIYSAKRPAPYALPQEVKFWLQIAWGIITFGTSILYLKILVVITLHSERQLSDQARHDALTGLFNRSGYDQILQGIDARSTTLVLIDIDRFKEINDSYGHETGDLVLKKVADEIRRHFRQDDRAFRLGGDEFVVLMGGQTELSEAPIAAKIDGINAVLAVAPDLPAVTVSAGAAFGGENADRLFERADKALYERKQSGRGGCCFDREA